ncbi:sensor domain-containing diguanylate cyclase [Eubacteriaceae bacterium ES3]|nr:sensor domain-containing diguanylate cyclase [Eubacteriaceae bacterium ES3]
MKSVKQKFRFVMLCIVTTVMIMSGFLFLGKVWQIAEGVSKGYARLFNNEIVGEINTYVNREIGVVEKLANTGVIKEFLRNPDGDKTLESAMESVREFNRVFVYHNTFLVPGESQDFYFFNQSSDGEISPPEGQLDINNERDRWYFDLLESSEDYSLKIDVDRFLDTLGMWLNMKVIDDGKILGVVGTQMGLEGFIDNILKLYEQDGVRTFVINEEGEIQLGRTSDEQPEEPALIELENNEITELSERDNDSQHMSKTIYEYYSNFDLDRAKLYFDEHGIDDSYVFEVTGGAFQYGAIAPILDSGWYVITFYDMENIISLNNLLFYFIVAMGLMGLLAILINMAIEKMMIQPFSKIMESTVLKEGERSVEIYGLSRNDEFGELARSIDTMSRQLVEAIPVGLFILGQDQVFKYGNPYFLKQFKCESSEEFKQVMEESPEKIFGSRGIFHAFLDRMIRKSSHLSVELELHDLEGEMFWAEIQVERIKKNAFEWEYEGILINVTNQKNEESRLIEEASRDSLTGIYNRAYFNRKIEKQMEHADRYRSDLSMVIFDLDHFKKINDTFGHQIGDAVLIKTAEMVEEMLRQTDILVRWGGEEFAILMPETTLEAGIAVSERIRQVLESFEHPDAKIVTASFGVAQRARHEEMLSFFTRADEALYEAKETGRNRVCGKKEGSLS